MEIPSPVLLDGWRLFMPGLSSPERYSSEASSRAPIPYGKAVTFMSSFRAM